MGKWYKVTKRINGRLYDYWQRTFRIGKTVKTENRYIGPARASVQTISSKTELTLADALDDFFAPDKLSGSLRDAIGAYKMEPANDVSRGHMARAIISAAQEYPDEAQEIAAASKHALRGFIGRTIYRAGDDTGSSWTFDRDVAASYANGSRIFERSFDEELLSRVLYYDNAELGIKWQQYGETFHNEHEIFLSDLRFTHP